MKLSEATQSYKLCKARLIALAKNGTINGFQDPDNKRGDWIFEQESIQNYRQSQGYKIREKVLEIVRSLKQEV